MTNKTKTYNTGKAIADNNELKQLIFDAQESGDWSKVEQANVSNVTDMSHLFDDVKGIENLNLDGWDTSSVKNMYSMFYKSDYNHPLHFSVARACPERARIGYDTSSVKNIRFMFANSQYNHPLRFDTSKVGNMDNVFKNASITSPITFTGGNISDDVQDFIDETNIAYNEKCKLEDVVHNERDTNHHNSRSVASSFKL